MSKRDLTVELKAIALTLMEGLACARSLTVAILIRHGEWDQLVNLKSDPSQYLDSEDYWAANAATEFLRKCVDVPTSINTEEVALQKWRDAELSCKKTNDRLDPYLHSYFNEHELEGRILDFIQDTRKIILSVIGPLPPKELDCFFGPGATLSDRSRATTVADKMSSPPTLTPKAWIHIPAWIATKWAKAQAALGNDLIEVKGNHFFTVDKDATTKRACAKEPSINVTYQLALGKNIRLKLLNKVGIDLNHGQTIHGQVARLGSLTGEFATIDLSSASDTICRNLVKLLLPNAWFEALDSLRSPYTRLPDGKWVKLEKFSSMGNGFTFELETLIFYALTRCAMAKSHGYTDGELLVFGDDIICPTRSANEVLAVLRYFGFTPNKRKTFTSGNFRESCGSDFFCGVPVRAHYVEEAPYEPQHYIGLANGIRRMAKNHPGNPRRWDRVMRAWFCCLDNIPSTIRRCRGPEDLGDIVITDDQDRWSIKTTNSIRYVRGYAPATLRRVRWEGFAYDVQYAAAIFMAGKAPDKPWRDPEGGLTPRNAVLGYHECWIPFS